MSSLPSQTTTSAVNKLKLVVVGDANVGKTNLINCITKKTFEHNSRPTLGVDFSSKEFMVYGQQIQAQIWDTAGQEQYRGLPKLYYRFARGVLIVFDLSSYSSFQHCERWVNEVHDFVDTIPIILVGNKSDLQPDQQCVSQLQAEKFIRDHQIHSYFKTSALKADNVYATFQTLVEQAVCNNNNDIQQQEPSIRYRKSVSKTHLEKQRSNRISFRDSNLFRRSPSNTSSSSTNHNSSYFLESSGSSRTKAAAFSLHDKRATPASNSVKKRKKKCCT